MRGVVLAAGVTAAVAGAWWIAWAQISPSGIISGCISSSGSIRVTEPTSACRPDEVAVSWYTKAGADAALARITTAAGGALGGAYPDAAVSSTVTRPSSASPDRPHTRSANKTVAAGSVALPNEETLLELTGKLRLSGTCAAPEELYAFALASVRIENISKETLRVGLTQLRPGASLFTESGPEQGHMLFGEASPVLFSFVSTGGFTKCTFSVLVVHLG